MSTPPPIDQQIVNHIELCARSHEPDVRLIGNVRAADILGAVQELNRLRDAIREHRAQKADDRCIGDDVMLAFVGPRPPGMVVCHWNGHPGDDRLENLRYDTYSANEADKVRHARMPRGEHKPSSKLTTRQVAEIRQILARQETSISQIARSFDVSRRVIQDIRSGRSWRGIGEL